MTCFRISGLIITVCLLFASCAQRAFTRIESVQAPCPRTISQESDTISYAVAFNDTSERNAFVFSFNQFLQKYSFIDVLKDTVKNFIHIRILPAAHIDTVYQPLTKVEQARIIEDIIEETIAEVSSDTAAPVFTDSILPEFGGIVRMYLPRKSIDPLFSRFFTTYPFSKSDSAISDGTVLIVADSSLRKVTLKMNGKITNAENRTLSALDFIDIWTSILKKHPAEGYALFKNIVGVREFIAGNEATVRGFSAADESTIILRLSSPDTLAVSRLLSRRLMDEKFKLGLYHVSQRSSGGVELLANALAGPDKPYLQKITLLTGGDPNPILSFSLNKYDAVVLSSINDLEYARRNLSQNASLLEIPGDRYFLACASNSHDFRLFLKKQVNAGDLLRNLVKAEGTPINSVTTENMEIPVVQHSGTGQIPSNQNFKILYCKDDPISKVIAEKLLATLSHARVSVNLAAADQFEYERSLIIRDYDCAVGWVPQSVTRNINEQLRLASIWFNDETDVLKRLQDNIEIPLFAIKRYLLKKNDLHLYRNSIQGLFWKTEKSAPQPLLEN